MDTVNLKHEHIDNISAVPDSQTSAVLPASVILTPRRSTRVQGRKRALSSANNCTADDSKVDLKLLTSDSPSPSKKKRGYAAPETYAHLDDLPDILMEDLDGAPLQALTSQLLLITQV
jgi:TDG/mug DNA glycosylase family protein